MQGGTRLSVASLPRAIETAPLAHALTSSCAELSSAGSVALKFLPRLRKLDGQPACLFDLFNGTIVFSGGCALSPSRAAQLLRSLLGDGYPVRKLLVPDGLAAGAIRTILQERRLRLLHQRRQRFFHAPPALLAPRLVSGAPRRAEQADLDRLARLITTGASPWLDSADAQAWRQAESAYRVRAVAEGRCYVWERGDAVAWAMVGPAGPDSYEIVDVATAPDARRRGFAGSLLAHLSAGMTPLAPMVFVEQDNGPAEALYLSLGFRAGGWWRCVLFEPS